VRQITVRQFLAVAAGSAAAGVACARRIV